MPSTSSWQTVPDSSIEVLGLMNIIDIKPVGWCGLIIRSLTL